MKLLDFIKLLLSYKKWLLIVPILVAALVLFLTIKQPRIYVSEALLYTGIVPTSDGTINVQARVDVYAVNNAIDNIQTIILSRQVLHEVSLRLMARHIHQMRTDQKKLESSVAKFWREHPEQMKEIPSGSSEEDLFAQLQKKMDHYTIRWLLSDALSFYSTNKIEKGLKVMRSGSSDLLKVQFTANDAVLAQETLRFLIEIFTQRFKDLKKSEVGSMVAFFEKEVAKAAERLAKVAYAMKEFQVRNRIINYYEQTHLTSIETEHLNGQYYDELMKLAASEQAYQDLKAKLGNPYQQALSSEEIIRTQQQISQWMTKKQLIASTGGNHHALNDSILFAEEKLRKSISKLYVGGRTEEGVSKKEILKEWLEKFIALSEAQARVVVMEKRKVKQEKEYDFYAPLGSELHNFERQMDVAEREYLDLLHSLNQARLRQQSAESSTSMTTVDSPSLPLNAEPSKLKLLVVIGWLGSLLIIMGVILFIEYFDSTLQSPERAESITGLSVLGAGPRDLSSRVGVLAQANMTLRYMAAMPQDASSKKILFVNKNESVSSEASLLLAKQLQKLSQKVALVGEIETPANLPVIPLQEMQQPSSSYDTLIASLPSFESLSENLHLIKWVNEIVLVVPGDDTWSSADNQTVGLLERITGKKPYLLLTDIHERRLENWLGEFPKDRSRFRRLIKKIIKFQFN
jgi:uncharacterized protein involved in exopolysaccharide biosynthesis